MLIPLFFSENMEMAISYGKPTVKIVFCGASKTGKTSIVQVLNKGEEI